MENLKKRRRSEVQMSVMYKSDMDLRIGRGSEVQMSVMYKLDMDLRIGRRSESYIYLYIY